MKRLKGSSHKDHRAALVKISVSLFRILEGSSWKDQRKIYTEISEQLSSPFFTSSFYNCNIGSASTLATLIKASIREFCISFLITIPFEGISNFFHRL